MSDSAPSPLVAGALAGNVTAVARLLTVVERGDSCAMTRAALETVYARAGKAHVVGLTGVPGSGKSTLAARLARQIRNQGRRVGIVAVDPTSPFSGGAILGDRIRMGELADDPGVFIRSMATRGALGGLSRSTLDAVDVLDAAGYDTILIETVGVGQDEVDVVRAAHTTVVVSAPGLGDDIQAVKAGILEIADIHVVSKCDRPDADRTIADLKGMLALGPAATPDWPAPVLATSAAADEGIEALAAAITRHRDQLLESGELQRRQRQIARHRVLAAAEGLLRDRLLAGQAAPGGVGDKMEALLTAVEQRKTHPHAAATALIAHKEADR